MEATLEDLRDEKGFLDAYLSFLDKLYSRIYEELFRGEKQRVGDDDIAEVWMRLSQLNCARMLGHNPGSLPEKIHDAYAVLYRVDSACVGSRPSREEIGVAIADIHDAVRTRLNQLTDAIAAYDKAA